MGATVVSFSTRHVRCKPLRAPALVVSVFCYWGFSVPSILLAACDHPRGYCAPSFQMPLECPAGVCVITIHTHGPCRRRGYFRALSSPHAATSLFRDSPRGKKGVGCPSAHVVDSGLRVWDEVGLRACGFKTFPATFFKFVCTTYQLPVTADAIAVNVVLHYSYYAA